MNASSLLALIPARAGSKGIRCKNFRWLGGRPLWMYSADAALGVPESVVVLDSDAEQPWGSSVTSARLKFLRRPPELAQDDTPMIAVVQHALEQIPGPSDQIIVLLQPTQPFRTPDHIRQAIKLLEDSGADSVVSVVELPKTHSPEYLCFAGDGYLVPWLREWGFSHCDQLPKWGDTPVRRQDAMSAHKRDGTCYAFRRATVEQHGDVYGRNCVPLIIPPEESCELDTEADWREVERRWSERA